MQHYTTNVCHYLLATLLLQIYCKFELKVKFTFNVIIVELNKRPKWTIHTCPCKHLQKEKRMKLKAKWNIKIIARIIAIIMYLWSLWYRHFTIENDKEWGHQSGKYTEGNGSKIAMIWSRYWKTFSLIWALPFRVCNDLYSYLWLFMAPSQNCWLFAFAQKMLSESSMLDC